MAAIKLQKFLGAAPKISSELLPDGAGQVAENLKLYSGDLLPYHQPSKAGTVSRTGTVQTIYGMRDPSTDDLVWLSWANDVDIVVASDTSDDEQRIYYTGDGVPKVTTYELATSGSAPYPNSYYELGLPLPTVQPSAAAAGFTTATTSHYERDAANTAIITTGSAHGLRTGNVVTVSGFTGSPAEEFNATNVRITVTSDTTFEYYNAGDAEAETADTNGDVDLAGNTVVRQYVYTWYTPWQEESIASEPSDEIFLKEGETVTVSSLPTSRPSGDNFIRGMRLYRTLTSARGTEFYLLSTLWFPISTATVARSSNVVTMTFDEHHNLSEGDRFKVSGCTDTSFNITDGEVASVVDDYTITFAQTDSDVAEKAETSGTMYHDVAELPTDSARYWGDGSYDFTDDFDYLNLTTILATDNYDAPPSNLQGLVEGQNNMLVGFFGNQLCFAEPGQPHAWPTDYRRTVEFDIVGVISVGGYLLVLTEKYAYRVTGSDPATLNVARIDKPYPCVSKRSIVNMGYGALYATHGGLALWSPSSGLVMATESVHHWDTWDDAIDPSTIVASFYEDRYFATHGDGAFTFERDETVGGYYVTISRRFTAAWVDPSDNSLYYIADTSGDVYLWDDPSQPFLPGGWKSKTIVTKDYLNLGAARVIADFVLSDEELAVIEAYNEQAVEDNEALWTNAAQLGTVGGPTDYTVSSVRDENHGEVNTYPVNGDGQMTNLLSTGDDNVQPVTFELYVDKALKATRTVRSDAIFRLPSGYKSDTFEITVSGSARIRIIYVGETPYGLRSA